MDSMKLRIKTRLLELEYEGGNKFVQDHLTQLLEKLAEISVAPPSVIEQVNSHMENMSSLSVQDHVIPASVHSEVSANSTQQVGSAQGNAAKSETSSQSPFNFKKLQELADHSVEDPNVSAYGLIRPKGIKG